MGEGLVNEQDAFLCIGDKEAFTGILEQGDG